MTLVAAGGMATLMFVLTRRNTRSTAYEGAVMRTGFGDSAFVTENPSSSTRYAYDAVESISTYGGFVFVRYVGSLVLRIYPTQIFPSEIVQRLETDIDSRPPGRRP